MKKTLSIILSLVLIVLSLSCLAMAAELKIGDVDGNGEIKATDARMILQHVANIKTLTPDQIKRADIVGNGDGVKATDARMILQIVAGLKDAPSTPSDSPKAELAKLFNEESVKAAKGTYNWTRTCEFTKDVDVGSATGTLNNIIAGVDENADLNSVVGGFLGVGTASGTEKDAGKCAIIPMNLTESDIKDVQRDSEQVTLILNDSKNPSNGGNTPFNHVSNDFITKKDVEEKVKESGVDMITVKSLDTNYHSVRVTARLDSNGNPSELTITYKMYATLGLRLSNVSNINGTGEIETKIKYTNIKY